MKKISAKRDASRHLAYTQSANILLSPKPIGSHHHLTTCQSLKHLPSSAKNVHANPFSFDPNVQKMMNLQRAYCDERGSPKKSSDIVIVDSRRMATVSKERQMTSKKQPSQKRSSKPDTHEVGRHE
jgi:uncharacterized protein YpiB (UPF0302 family)